MNETDLYNNVVLSLIKWLRTWQAANAPDSVYFDWDGHAQTDELPKDGVLIGPSGCGMAEDTPNSHEVVFSFGVSTYLDPNLFQMRSLISSLYGSLPVATRLPVYDATSGAVVSWMVIKTPRSVTPMTQAEVRSLQFVQLTALIDPGATSSLR